MTRLTTIQTNFSSGEQDPLLAAQVDLKAYRNGARQMRNCARRSTGGAERRGGTYDLNAMAGLTRLAEFEFSDNQRYLIGFSHQKIEIFDMNGTLLQTIAGAPWTAAQIFYLTYTQLGDTMAIFHQEVQTRLLKRTGPSAFSLSTFAFDQSVDGNKLWQPYYKFEAAGVTLTPSGATGAITLTASAGFFTAAHVGNRIRIYDSEVLVTGYTSPTVVNATVQGTLKGKLALDPYKTANGTLEVEATHVFHGLATGANVTFSGSNGVAGIPATDLDGAHAITIIDDNTYSFTSGGFTAATASEDGGGPNVTFSTAGAPTRNWLEPAISAVRGWPGCGAFHEGRLWFGGTISQPDGVMGSKSLSPFNFDVGEGLDGESVQTAVGSEDISRVRHMMSNGDLQMFSATTESIFLTRQNEPITPANARIKKQSNAGVGHVQPVIFDGATLFVQENGLSVSELVYSDSEAGYIATPISTLAGHLIRNPQSCAASAGLVDRAEPTSYFANEDGTVAVFHSMRLENIAGWGLWTLGAGEVKSVAAIGPYVFFCVYVRGGYRLYRLADEQIVQLDGAVHHVSGTGAKTDWTLDARVRGRTVSIVSELGYHGDYAIDGTGALTLSVPVENVVAGDAFYFTIETLPPAVSLPQGERVGLRQRIVRAIVHFSDTYSATVNDARVETRYAGEDFAGAVQPLDGHFQITTLGYSREPTITITQGEPLFARVLGLTMEVNV